MMLMISLQFYFKFRIRTILNATVAATTVCFYFFIPWDLGFGLPIRLDLSNVLSIYRAFLGPLSSSIISWILGLMDGLLINMRSQFKVRYSIGRTARDWLDLARSGSKMRALSIK